MKQLPSNYIYKKCHKANYSYAYLLDRKNFLVHMANLACKV